jgi:signal transduction histidine kinase
VNALLLAALLVYTFGTFAYGAILLLWVREWGQMRWAAPQPQAAATTDLAAPRPMESRQMACAPPAAGRPPEADAVSGALFLVSFFWFLSNLAITLVNAGPPVRQWSLQFVAMWLAFAFPPLIMHVTWGEASKGRTTMLNPLWRRIVWVAYPIAHGLALASTLGFLGVGGVSRHTMSFASSIALGALFVCAALYAIVLMSTGGESRETSRRDRQSRRWWIGLFALMIPLFVAIVTLDRVWPQLRLMNDVLELATRSLPLVFMFVGTYFENRFHFFDLFIKRGLALGATIVILTAAFALALPFLQRYDGRPLAPWIYAVLLLPVITALPWLHARIGSVLDQQWLGRRFKTVDAVTRFLSGLRPATTEAQLVSRAQEGLGEIFAAPVVVRTHSKSAPIPLDLEVVQVVPVRLGDDVIGWFLMGRRASEAPYFSEDIVLLRSLADVFASVLHNLRLRIREQDQERRAQELSLHASRSELKALRAQINPHFLFNALNAIAGLIPREPAVADRTIEKLAEVFRYALRGADSEWAVLEDELEFARAYLDVEHARFGARLTTEVRLSDDVRSTRVPTMIVQTLVENAVKHGVAAVRGRASIEVDARRDGKRVRIVVSDNGPGLDPDRRPVTHARRGGYGLANIRQRLDGYFGPEAALIVERDPLRGLTVATVLLPFLAHEPQSRPAAVAEVRP